MDNINNPYTPNAEATPEALIGRDGQTEAFSVLLERLTRGRTEQSMIITGLRGVGKTVLLNKFAELAERIGWEVVELEASKHDETAFRQSIFSKFRAALLHLSPRRRWSKRARHAAEVLSSFVLSVDREGTFSVTWDVAPSEGYADHGDLGLDLTDVFLAVGEVAKERTTGIVVLIDSDDVGAAREAYEAKLDSSFFRVRLDRATPLQTAYMRAMAELGSEPQKAADVAARMGRESSQVAPIRSQLIDMGLLYTPQHGYAAFAVPDFDTFMLRAVPEPDVPEIHRRRRRR